jgi:dolichol-phosphate mannosyltransferase
MPRSVVVVPTYNERENLPPLLDAIFAQPLDCDVLVVDDNSPDGTGRLVDELRRDQPRLRAHHRPQRLGLGAAYVDAFRRVLAEGYDYVVSMDADLSHDPRYLPDMFAAAAECFDVVVGSRYMTGVSVVNWPIWRLALSLGANTYARVITGLPVRDCTSGFQCFRASALRAAHLDAIRTNGYSFLIELKYRALRAGCRIGEVPIIFVDRRIGTSKITRREIYASILTVWKLRLGLYPK